MTTVIVLSILLVIAFKIYRPTFRSTRPGIFDALPGTTGLAQPEMKPMPRPRKHAVDVLRQARGIASAEYGERLLDGTATDADRRRFELAWANAKSAVRARYGQKVLNDALYQLQLLDEQE